MTDDARYTQARAFLDALFGSGEGLILVWTVDTEGRKRSRWFAETSDAAHYATSDALRESRVYVGCGLHGRELAEFERGTEADIGGIVGLWADIDVGTDGHEGAKRYPVTEEEASHLLAAMPLPPSLVVRTGGGLHAWWLLREPWCFDGDEDRADAKRVARGWGARLQEIARERGVQVDSVWDLSRVLRIPGTFRNKAGAAQALTELATDNLSQVPRYNPSDFEPFLVEQSAAQAPAEVGPLTLKRGAQPPAMKFMALVMNEDRFMDTFKGQRKDFKDTSQSAHDLAMATFAAHAAWTDQEIADLVMASREANNAKPEKALRRDYVEHVIGLARAGVRSNEVEIELAAIAATRKRREQERQLEREKKVEEIIQKLDAGGERGEILAELSFLFGITVKGIVQYGRDQARYSIRTDDGEISLGSVDALTNQDKFRARLVESAHRAIPSYKKSEWIDLINTMLAVVEVLDDDEVTRTGELRSWIASLVTQSRRWVGEQYEGALFDGSPFFLNGNVHVHAQTLAIHVKSKLLEQANQRDICDRLRAAGFLRKQVTGRPIVEGKKRHFGRSYWLAPIEFLGPVFRELGPISYVGQTQGDEANSQNSEGFTN
jgi:hypothetical protein